MNAMRFEQLSKELIKHCWDLTFKKGSEYASDEDRLANFRQPTSLLGINPAEVCLNYDMKHIASMVKMAKDANKGQLPTKDFLMEKVGDYINYGLLFYANMMEMMTKEYTIRTEDEDELKVIEDIVAEDVE